MYLIGFTFWLSKPCVYISRFPYIYKINMDKWLAWKKDPVETRYDFPLSREKYEKEKKMGVSKYSKNSK